MKVLYVLHTTRLSDGSTKSFLNMLYGVLPKGIEALVILPDSNGIKKTLDHDGIANIVVPFRKSVYPPRKTLLEVFYFLPRLLLRIILNKWAVFTLYGHVKHFGPDLIHTNVSVIDIGYKLSKLLDIPHIWHIREYADLDFNFIHYPSKKHFIDCLHVDKSYAICITKDILSYYGLSSHINACVIYNGILSNSCIKYEPQKERYFLYAGRLESNKGIYDLLLAFSELISQHPEINIRLKIAGDTPFKDYEKFLKDETIRLGIDQYVEYLGVINNILDVMSKAFLVIVPSVSEGFGRVMAEAMCSGALVLGRNTAGTKEQFDNGLELTGCEIGLRYTTHQELIQQMYYVQCRDIKEFEPIILLSQKVVSDLYSVTSNSTRVFQFYTSILSDN